MNNKKAKKAGRKNRLYLKKNRWRYSFRILAVGIILLALSFLADAKVIEISIMMQTKIIITIANFFSSTFFVLFLITALALMIKQEKISKAGINKREALLISTASAFVLCFLLKLIFARDRPYDFITLLGMPDYSFPSSHTAVVFSMVPFLRHISMTQKTMIAIMIIFVALSRIVLLKHFFSDVIAGMIIGLMVGMVVHFMVVKNNASKNK